MIEERTLVDGGQTAEAIAARLVAWLGEARTSLDIALYDVRLPGGGRRRGGRRDPAAAAPRRRRAHRLQPGRRPRRQAAAASAAHRAVAARAARRAAAGDPGRARPHAPQVRRAGPGRGVDRLDELDARLVDARGERARRRWPRRASRARTRATSTTCGRRGRVEGSGSFDAAPIDVGGVAVRAWFSPGRGPELSHRIAKRIGAAKRRVRIASPVLTAAPILAALNQALAEGTRRRGRRLRRDPGRAGLRAVARQRELGVEGAAARARALRAAVVGEGLHAVRARRRPRLHAREGHGRRRRRLRRLVQPLALGRGERRERPRDRRRRVWRSGWRRSSTPCARRYPAIAVPGYAAS